jgi:hypothetical protein
MSLEKISKDQEKQLVRGVERVIDLVKTASLQPTTALVKVAQEYGFGPQEVRRISEAYNISRSLANQKEKQGEARCEPFDLAHADLAIKQLYPSDIKSHGQIKTASVLKARALRDSVNSTNYIEKVASNERVNQSNFKAMVKVAGAEDAPQRPDQLAHGMEKKAARQKFELTQTEEAHNRAKFHLLDSLTKAASAIRTSQKPFDRIEQAIVSRYGTGAIKLAALLFNTSKQASFKGQRATTFGQVIENYEAEPYKSIDQFVKASAQFKELSTKFASLKKQAATEGDWVSNFLEKSALGLPGPGEVLNRWNQGLNTSADPLYQQEVGKAISKIHDPKYTNELRRIRAQSMITDWISNDDVIKALANSPEGVEKVLQAYNDLASVSPEAAENPVLAKSYVRRMIQMSEIDPHEVGQMVGIGNQLADSKLPENQVAAMNAAIAADPKALAFRSNPYMYRQKPVDTLSAFKGAITGKTQGGFDDPNLNLQYKEHDTNQQRNKLTDKRDRGRDQLERQKFEYDKQRNQTLDSMNFPSTLAEIGNKYHELSGHPNVGNPIEYANTARRNLNQILGGNE